MAVDDNPPATSGRNLEEYAMVSRLCSLTALLVFIVASCSDGGPTSRINTVSRDALATNQATCLDLSSVPSWQNGIAAIFETQCASCHPGSQLTDYGSYNGVKNGISAVLMRIDAGTMPQGSPLSQVDRDLIHAWVSGGMPEFDVSPAPGTSTTSCTSKTTSPTVNPSPTPVVAPVLQSTYALGVQPIMAAYCTGCHSAAGGQTPYLDTLSRVKLNFGNIMSAVQEGSMPAPVTATSKLPADKISILNNWGTAPNSPYGQWAP